MGPDPKFESFSLQLGIAPGPLSLAHEQKVAAVVTGLADVGILRGLIRGICGKDISYRPLTTLIPCQFPLDSRPETDYIPNYRLLG